MRTLFVTCGSTVPFPQLAQCVANDQFVSLLARLQFHRVIIQFGKNYVDEFNKLLAMLKGNNDVTDRSLDAQTLQTDIIPCYTRVHGVEIYGLEFLRDIQHVISTYADLVISHAGTGSILDSLRLSKPLIVCVNGNLMDNHQQQIADRFESNRYVWATSPDLNKLMACVANSQMETLASFPRAHNQLFEQLLRDIPYN